MKDLKYVLSAALLGLTLAACEDLDLQSKGLLDEALMFSSDGGVQQYFAGLYNELPVEEFNYYQGEGYKKEGNAWEGQKNSPAAVTLEGNGRGTNMGGAGYWPYGQIRKINTFLDKIPEYRDNYKDDEYNALVAEGHFLRAFYYFGMAKRYGGVPIIDVTQNPLDSVENLKVPRATEYDTWKFIYSDLKIAMEKGSKDVKRTTRASAYSAAALMARAMLYAASVARYGNTLGTSGPAVSAGLMLMPEDRAEEFYGYVIEACEFIKQAGFTLHSGADAATAFAETFVNDTEEDILVKHYGVVTELEGGGSRNTGLFHSWDAMTLPLYTGLSSSVGCALQPAWESIRLFQMPAIADEDGKPVRFDSPSDLWDNDEMEGRAKGTFFFPGMTEPVSGLTMDFLTGVYTTYGDHTQADGCPYGNTDGGFVDQNRKYGKKDGTNDSYKTPDGRRINGLFGMATDAGDEGWVYMGASVRKYVGMTASRGKQLHESYEPWKVFRYGEVLCNWAEACYELGLLRNNEALKQEAVEHINELHRRAGARPYTLKSNPENVNEIDPDRYPYSYDVDENLQYIRDEFYRELCFENHIYWDLRRWRVYHDLFQNTIAHCLSCYYVVDEDKYIFLPDEPYANGFRRTFSKSQYYEQIDQNEINKNDLLIKNDGF